MAKRKDNNLSELVENGNRNGDSKVDFRKDGNYRPANIGIEDQARDQIVGLLNNRLADTFILYTKTRKYHWNVTGVHFGQLHEFFEEQYTQLEENMDLIAERVRKIGGISIGTVTEMKQCSTLTEEPGINPIAFDMLRDLLDDHEEVIRSLREDVDTTDELHDIGTNDFLTGIMEEHEKMAWMLRAHVEGMDAKKQD